MIGEFAQLVGAAMLGAMILAGIGYVPTQRMGGGSAVTGMYVGIGICVISSMLGALPVVLTRDPRPASRQAALLGTIAIRMLATLMLFGAAALSRQFDTKAMAVWTGVGYICLLGIETGMAIRVLRKREVTP
jgi:hypothetical protein